MDSINPSIEKSILGQAVKLFGGKSPVKQLTLGYENLVYQYLRDGKECVLRLTHPERRTRNQILAELEWTGYLSDSGLKTPVPLKSVNDRLVETVGDDDQMFWATSFEKVPGRHLEEDEWSPELFEEWGRLMGKMHLLTKRFKPSSPEIKRPDWDADPVLNLDKLNHDYPVIADKFSRVISEISRLPRDKDSFGLVHGDIHPNNLFYADEGITLIDFDSCAYDWFVHDFAVALYHIFVHFQTADKENLLKTFLANFWKGYLQENEVDESWISRIPLFLRFQHIWMFVFAATRIGMDNVSPDQGELLSLMQHNIENDVPVVEPGTWFGPPGEK